MIPGRWTPPALLLSLGLTAGLVTAGPTGAVELLGWPGAAGQPTVAVSAQTPAERTAALLRESTLRDQVQVHAARTRAEVSARAEAERLAAEEAARVEAERLAAVEAARVEAARVEAAREAERVAAEQAAAEVATRAAEERAAAAKAAAERASRAAQQVATPAAAVSSSLPRTAPSGGTGCDGAPGWENVRGQRAMSRLGIDPGAYGWSVAFLGARSGVQAMAIGPERRIEVYVRSCAKMSDNTLLWALAHEMGHMVDISRGNDARRAEYLAVRGISPRQWFGCNRCTDFDTPAGDFAEVFAYARTGLSGHFGSRVAPAPNAGQLDRLRPLLS